MNPRRRIGLMSAMHQELAEVLQTLPDERRERAAGRDFWLGHWRGHEVVAVLSRIGKVAAATTATALIERFGVTAIVFTGVAGGLGEGVAVGNVVLATSFVQHDMDASPLFPRYEVPLYGRTRFDTDAALTDRLRAAAAQVLAHPAQRPCRLLPPTCRLPVAPRQIIPHGAARPLHLCRWLRPSGRPPRRRPRLNVPPRPCAPPCLRAPLRLNAPLLLWAVRLRRAL